MKPLFVSEEEAMTLLEVLLLCETQDNPIHAHLMQRIGEVCREFLHPEGEVSGVHHPDVAQARANIATCA